MNNSPEFYEKKDFSNRIPKTENDPNDEPNQTNVSSRQDTVGTSEGAAVGAHVAESPANCVLPAERMPVFESINLVSSSESEVETENSSVGSGLETGEGSSPANTDGGSYCADDEKSNSEISATYTEDDASSSGKEEACNVTAEKDDCESLSASAQSPPKDPNESLEEFGAVNESQAVVEDDDDDDASSPVIRRKKKKHNVFNDTESDDGLQSPGAEEEEEIVDEDGSSTGDSNASQEKLNYAVSDFDKMMQTKRAERQRGRKRHNEFTTHNDDLIDQLIDRMEDAAYSDRRLNARGKPAIKKVSMLKHVMSQLIKKDLQVSFLEHNILRTLTEWLSPLPSKCLPCLPIRENILRLLEDFPIIDSRLLKYSGIGRAVMFLRDNPEETKENRERCSQLVAKWARPIHDLSCDYKAMSKEERQRRDFEMSLRYRKQKENATLSAKRVKVDSLDQALSNATECEAIGPGDPGWVPRARVPQPSTRDYIQRPKSQLECTISTTSKPNRYEVMAKKYLKAKRALATHRSGATLSILGQKM